MHSFKQVNEQETGQYPFLMRILCELENTLVLSKLPSDSWTSVPAGSRLGLLGVKGSKLSWSRQNCRHCMSGGAAWKLSVVIGHCSIMGSFALNEMVQASMSWQLYLISSALLIVWEWSKGLGPSPYQIQPPMCSVNRNRYLDQAVLQPVTISQYFVVWGHGQ